MVQIWCNKIQKSGSYPIRLFWLHEKILQTSAKEERYLQ